jgi:hypothetical protein
MSARIFRFVRHEYSGAYIELGWINHKSLEGTHHGVHATLLEWPKDTPPVEPEAQEIPLAG